MIVQKIQFVCKFFFVCVEYCAACKVIILWKFPNSPSWSLCRSYPSAIIYAARLSDEHHRLLNMVDGGIEEAVRPLIPHFHLRITFSIFSQIEQDVCIKKQLEAVGVEFVFRKRAVPLLAILPHSYGFHSSSVLLPIDGGSSALCVTAGSPTPPCLFPATSFLYLRACVLCLCLCICVFVYLCICLFVYFFVFVYWFICVFV